MPRSQRLLERGHQRVRIVGRHGDGIDALRDERIQHFDLAFGRRRRRAGEDHFGVELLGGFVGALVHGIEEAVAQRLGDQADAHALPVCAGSCCLPQPAEPRRTRRTRPL